MTGKERAYEIDNEQSIFISPSAMVWVVCCMCLIFVATLGNLASSGIEAEEQSDSDGAESVNSDGAESVNCDESPLGKNWLNFYMEVYTNGH